MIYNYIITIHNKEYLIEEVLESVIRCSHKDSYIYPVLDGCTDNTELVVDKVIAKYKSANIVKLFTPDVHEILCINEGLKAANQAQDGYNIILQDDVILKDYDLEEKIDKLYHKIGDRLAYVSFRLGANIKDVATLSFKDFVESAYGHGIDNTKVLLPGEFAFRSIAIKSPVCIPTRIIREFGLLDEKLAPCFHDDTEYCLRMIRNGYKNGVFALKYESELDWGGTRKSPNPNYERYIKNNLSYLKKEYAEDISSLVYSKQENKKMSDAEFVDVSTNKEALKLYKVSQKKRKRYEYSTMTNKEKVKCLLSTGIFRMPYKLFSSIVKIVR